MLRRCLLLLTLGAAVVAQVGVIPDGGYDLRHGGSAAWSPASYAPGRCQVLYDASVLRGVAGRQVQGVALRRDGAWPLATTAHSAQVTLALSQLAVPTAVRAATTSYQANHGSDHAVVMAARLLQWPQCPPPGLVPAPFQALLPFDHPVTLGVGTQLLLEFDVAAGGAVPTTDPWPADAVDAYPGGQHGSLGNRGTGCPTGHRVAGNAPPVDGLTPLYFYAASGASAPNLVALGLTGSRDTDWAGVPLPLDLAAVGAPGCAVQVNGQLLRAAVVDAQSGEAWFWLGPVPAVPALAGATVFHQVLVVDPGFNALGVRASDHLRVTLGSFAPPVPALMLYSYGGLQVNDVPVAFRRAHLVLQLW